MATTQITWSNWKSTMQNEMARAASKCGLDISALELRTVNIDRTWGDLVGFIVTGSDDATNERAARFIAAWVSKNLTTLRNYDNQVRGEYQGVKTREGVTGHCVCYCYYPCAD